MPGTKNIPYFYSRTRISYAADYPVKSIFFAELTEERKAVLRIEGWNILETLQLTSIVKALFLQQNHDDGFFSFDKCGPDNVGICFNLHKSGTKALMLRYVEILFAGLDNLITRKGEVLSCSPRFRKTKDIIRDCIDQYCQHLQDGFPLEQAGSKIEFGPPRIIDGSKHLESIVIDPQQLELANAIVAGKPIIELLRKGVSLKIHPFVEPFFLIYAMPHDKDERDLSIVKENILALLEFNAPVSAPGDSLYQYRTILGQYLYIAYCQWNSELCYRQALEFLPRHQHAYSNHIDDEIRRDFINALKKTIADYPHWLKFHKDYLQLLMFIDNEETFSSPIPAFLAESSDIFAWVAAGQKAIRLARYLPAPAYRFTAMRDGRQITYQLAPGVNVIVPALRKIATNKGEYFLVKTLLLSEALRYPQLVEQLLQIYCRQFSVNNAEQADYFYTMLEVGRSQAYLDVISLKGRVLGFNIGEFVHVKKDNKPALIYHGILAAAENEVTQYQGLMARIIYFRGFLPLEHKIAMEALTVVELASLASYLQLINMGVMFNPQYNILMDWLFVLEKAIYSQGFYAREERFMEPASYYRVSDPLAKFAIHTSDPWYTRQTTLAASRLVKNLSRSNETLTKYDVVAFFKCNKRNYKKFTDYVDDKLAVTNSKL